MRFKSTLAGVVMALALTACAGMSSAPSLGEIHAMIRVDQAGEFGATRIYRGQLAVMGDRAPHTQAIAHMAEQEEGHRARFDALMAERGVRPTALQPFWSVAGYALGAATALMGPEAAMACTAAIEQEIDRHYTQQLDRLGENGSEPELVEIMHDNFVKKVDLYQGSVS